MIVKNIVYNESLPECCTLDLYLPDGVNNPPAHIFAHGGGLEGGNKDGLLPMAEKLLQDLVVRILKSALLMSIRY